VKQTANIKKAYEIIIDPIMKRSVGDVCNCNISQYIFLNKLSTPAYALDDTINASRNIRSCYFQRCHDVNQTSVIVDREMWAEYGKGREINILRVNFNDHNSVLVWTKAVHIGKRAVMWNFKDELYDSKYFICPKMTRKMP
jgi:hypothetical protein